MPRSVFIAPLIAALTFAACGGSDGNDATSESPAGADTTVPAAPTGISLVSVDDASATIATPPDDLVILDVRTPEEFAEGHIDGAIMIDFYRPDFAEEIAQLDPEVPYVVYCRSGNRSGQATEVMGELGFRSVRDVDGGVLAWQGAGLPLVDE